MFTTNKQKVAAVWVLVAAIFLVGWMADAIIYVVGTLSSLLFIACGVFLFLKSNKKVLLGILSLVVSMYAFTSTQDSVPFLLFVSCYGFMVGMIFGCGIEASLNWAAKKDEKVVEEFMKRHKPES